MKIRSIRLVSMMIVAAILCALMFTCEVKAASEVNVGKAVISKIETKSENPKISWKSVAGATGYRVYRKTCRDEKYVKVADTTKLTYTDKKWVATGGTKVSYKVRAYYKDAKGNTTWGGYSSAKTWTVPYKESSISLGSEAKEKKKVDLKVGDVVAFGHYEQDGNAGNGAEPVTWEVMEIKDGKAYLLGEDCVCCFAEVFCKADGVYNVFPEANYLWLTLSVRDCESKLWTNFNYGYLDLNYIDSEGNTHFYDKPEGEALQFHYESPDTYGKLHVGILDMMFTPKEQEMIALTDIYDGEETVKVFAPSLADFERFYGKDFSLQDVWALSSDALCKLTSSSVGGGTTLPDGSTRWNRSLGTINWSFDDGAGQTAAYYLLDRMNSEDCITGYYDGVSIQYKSIEAAQNGKIFKAHTEGNYGQSPSWDEVTATRLALWLDLSALE